MGLECPQPVGVVPLSLREKKISLKLRIAAFSSAFSVLLHELPITLLERRHTANLVQTHVSVLANWS